MSNKAYNPAADFDAVIGWINEQEAAKTASEMPDLDHGRPVSPGDRSAENTRDLAQYPGGGIDHAKDNSESSTTNAAPYGQGGIEQTLAGETNPSGPVKKILYRGSGDNIDDKLAHQLEETLKGAAELDRAIAEATNQNKTAAEANGQALANGQPANPALAIVHSYKTAGEERAGLLDAFDYGYQTADSVLVKSASDGSLAAWLKEAAMAEKKAAAAAKKKAAEDEEESDEEGSEEDDDEGGGSEEGGGPPGAESPTDAGPPVDAGGGGPPPVIPPGAGGGAGLPPELAAALGGGGGGPPPGGPPGGGMPPDMAGGGGDNLGEMAGAMQEGQMDPHMIMMLLQQLLQQAPPEMPPAKLAGLTKTAAVVKAVCHHVTSSDYKYQEPKTAESKAFREYTRRYIREQLQSARR